MSFIRILFTISIHSLLICLLCAKCNAQDDEQEYYEPQKINFFEFSVDPVFPEYRFGESLGKDLVGISMAYLRQRKLDRMDFFGVKYSYIHLGSITESFVDFEDRTSTELMNLHFVYRFFPDFYFWRIEPFIEASFGPQLVFTGTSTNFFFDDTANYTFDESDFGISYAVGVGFTCHIAGQFFLLSKYSFVGGNAMSYLVPGDYVSGLPIDNFERESSSINYHKLQFGFSISF